VTWLHAENGLTFANAIRLLRVGVLKGHGIDFEEIVSAPGETQLTARSGTSYRATMDYWRAVDVLHYVVLSEIPKEHAFAAVAPGVRFSCFAIFATLALCFASDFRVFTSSFVLSLRTVFFALAKPCLLICLSAV
jgi:hypothetical protein